MWREKSMRVSYESVRKRKGEMLTSRKPIFGELALN